MMKPKEKKAKTLAAILAVLALLCGCSSYSPEDFDAGEAVSPEELESIADLLREADTEKYPAETDENGETVVFWTSGGSVWHASRACPSLSGSSSLEKGSEAEAIADGKDRCCSICGNN